MKERVNRLYELRKSRNLTQTAVAYILRFSDRTVGGSGVDLHISEQKLLDLYRNLPPDGKAVIDGMVNGYVPLK